LAHQRGRGAVADLLGDPLVALPDHRGQLLAAAGDVEPAVEIGLVRGAHLSQESGPPVAQAVAVALGGYQTGSQAPQGLFDRRALASNLPVALDALPQLLDRGSQLEPPSIGRQTNGTQRLPRAALKGDDELGDLPGLPLGRFHLTQRLAALPDRLEEVEHPARRQFGRHTLSPLPVVPRTLGAVTL